MSAPAGRVLAIDPGRVRIGLAVSDPTGIIAQGLPSLRSEGRRKDLEALTRLVRDREIVEIVVGWPRNLDGSGGTMAAHAERLAADLEAATSRPVRLWDERFSSAEAERALREGGVRRERRREERDRVAAVLILQAYLDSRSSAGSAT